MNVTGFPQIGWAKVKAWNYSMVPVVGLDVSSVLRAFLVAVECYKKSHCSSSGFGS